MRSALRNVGPWAPPVLLMALIFVLSAMPGDDVDRGILYFLGRKAAHFAEYALLAYLWWRVLRDRLATRAALGLAFAITVTYAATDELHQRFVDGRVGTPRDVLIDAAGAASASALILHRRRRAQVAA